MSQKAFSPNISTAPNDPAIFASLAAPPRVQLGAILTNQVVLIAGCDSPTSRALSLALARAGADVALIYNQPHQQVEHIHKQIETEGRLRMVVPADLGEEVRCLEVVAETVRKLGHLDVVINYSTPPMQGELPNMETVERHYRSRILSGLFLTKAAVPRLRPGGVIINIADCSPQGTPNSFEGRHVSHTIMTLTKTLATSLGQHQIRVYGINPVSAKEPFDTLAAIQARAEQLLDCLLGLLIPQQVARQPSSLSSWRVNL